MSHLGEAVNTEWAGTWERIIVLCPGALKDARAGSVGRAACGSCSVAFDLELYGRSQGLSCLASPAMRPAGPSGKSALPPAGGILRVAMAVLVQLG